MVLHRHQHSFVEGKLCVLGLGIFTDRILHGTICQNTFCRCLRNTVAVALAINICE